MPSLTAAQAAQLTAAIHETSLNDIAFTAPADGYRLAANATFSDPDTPAFTLGITWADSGHGVLRIMETINGSIVTAAHTGPHQRIALNQLQRLLTMAIKCFRDNVSLAEMDAKARRKTPGANTSTNHVAINAPTTNEARTTTIDGLNETAAAATGAKASR